MNPNIRLIAINHSTEEKLLHYMVKMQDTEELVDLS
jgi:hypothetical protein